MRPRQRGASDGTNNEQNRKKKRKKVIKEVDALFARV
jgi:hypothetical protein